MIDVTEDVLSDMVQAIVREVAPERIYLFGSRARGDARTDSDIDLLIVESGLFSPGRNRWQEIKRIRRALSPFRIPKDVVVYTADEVAKWQDSVNHVIARALHEGKLLYERR
jgi:predicted nucleotidyltransferase